MLQVRTLFISFKIIFFLLFFCNSLQTYSQNSLKKRCTRLVSKIIKLQGKVPDQSFNHAFNFEDIDHKLVKVINFSHFGHLKKRPYPPQFNMGNEILIKIDSLGHFSLQAGSTEINARVLREQVDITSIDRKQHRSDFIMRIKGLNKNEILKLESFIHQFAEKRSLSCLNAIEYILKNALNIEFSGKRTLFGLHPIISNIFSAPLVRNSKQILETEIYRFIDNTLVGEIAKIEAIRKILISGSLFILPILPEIILNRNAFIFHFPLDKFNRLWQRISDASTVAWNIVYSTLHNWGGAFHVVKLMTFKKMEHGLLPVDHAWITGVDPDTADDIWTKNILFSSVVEDTFKKEPELDDDIFHKIGKYMGKMALKSNAADELIQGPKRRMPHVVNYLHGAVAYNSGKLIFNNFKDAMFYLSDPQFIADIYRFSKNEQREFIIILRERDYEPVELAYFLGFIRTHLKWYANANGPKKKVLYGGKAPYIVINIINGHWVKDINDLRQGNLKTIARPAMTVNYFQNEYGGNQVQYSFFEKGLAYFNYLILKVRGFQGGLVFTRRKVIEPKKYKDYLEKKRQGAIDDVIVTIPNPFANE